MWRPLASVGFATVMALALASGPAYAGSTRTPDRPKPTPPGQTKKAPAPTPALLAPEIFQVNPAKVNPNVQPNILILGQHLSAATTVVVGGRSATTVQAPDPNHLLVKLPDKLSSGSYLIEVTNDAGTAVATDPLVVDDGGGAPSTLQIFGIGGMLLLFVLVIRLARTPSIE